MSFGLWPLGLRQVSVSRALGSPEGQRSVKSLPDLEVLLVLELRQWVAPWRSGLEVRVWVFGSNGSRLGAFVSGNLVFWVSPFDLICCFFFSYFKFLQFS